MTEIVVLLDELAEYEAQAAYLELKKQELLDAVKIPAEVEAIHTEGLKRKSAIDAEYNAQRRARNEQEAAELAAVVVPDEVKAILDAIDRKRTQIRAETMAQDEIDRKEASRRKEAIDNEFIARVSDVYAQVANRRNEINAEFAQKKNAVDVNLEALTARIKDEVKRAGQTIKAKFYQAVYVKGRVAWNTDMLDGMVIAFPALEKARKVGDPSVTIRKVGK